MCFGEGRKWPVSNITLINQLCHTKNNLLLHTSSQSLGEVKKLLMSLHVVASFCFLEIINIFSRSYKCIITEVRKLPGATPEENENTNII